MKKLHSLILEICSPLRVSIIFCPLSFYPAPIMNCWAVLEMTVSMLPCAKISPAERTGSNDHCVALICVFLSYCCKNIPLPVQWLKTIPTSSCLQTRWFNIQARITGPSTTVHTVKLKLAAGRALKENSKKQLLPPWLKWKAKSNFLELKSCPIS